MKKLNYLFIILLTTFFSCNIFSQNESIKEYYYEICSKTEWSGELTPTKYKKDIKILVGGVKTNVLISELNKIVSELNGLIQPINISITEDRNDYNILVYFGSPNNYMEYIKDYSDSEILKTNWGLFALYPSGYDKSEILFSEVFVNTTDTRNSKQQKHLLREELTQSIGFPNDSYRYEESIFQQKWTEVTEYSKIDKEIIKMHYNL
jgi:hypothetical protein